ncbi:purine-nucleoside phosphorylase [Caldisalinibacter kiritimatiensis]|uniref:Purine nucleoside phosphorylase n=1 Tax=Caldisalinibacter kiritimatiensis TaxID=1304284 RepID=R1CWS6_9FIRM|nr:purine-nucleoside phosphorylase [Caldisalinibacter kiritimatiensis]EOD01074.1 Purine nucleoside phosphorylase [Caldisalinibacter kiritimatiensis]
MNLLEKINETKNFIEEKINIKPEIGMILGSGLGVLADEIEDAVILEYGDIPNFPESTVKGHKGRLVIGNLNGKKVIAMQGRFHYYEGYTMQQVTFPVRIMKALGVNKVIVTNAAGGVNTDFTPGDLMIITDHINLGFDNPLIGKNYEQLGPRFPDMSHSYSKELIEKAITAGEKLNISLKQGTYMFLTGPTYETPAEIRMANILGADAVGMSTVPEVIVAVHSGIEVLGISCITNMAAGILEKPLDHKEVIETTEKVRDSFIKLVKEIVKSLK